MSRSAGKFTETEMLVCRHLVCGLSQPEIAAELDVSKATVSGHLDHIYKKLGVRDHRGAVVALVDGHARLLVEGTITIRRLRAERDAAVCERDHMRERCTCGAKLPPRIASRFTQRGAERVNDPPLTDAQRTYLNDFTDWLLDPTTKRFARRRRSLGALLEAVQA